MFGERICTGFDFFIGLFDLGSLKWRFPNKLGVNDDSNGPDVHFIGVSLSLKNLRSDIVRCTANGFLFLLIVL